MEYYILRLWDCATPSFCSFDKIYVGTESDVRKAIASMKRAGVNEETVAAVSHYLSGDKAATHNIAYKDIPALEKCQLIRTSELKIEATEWEHINVWGFPYKMKCDSAEISQILVRSNEKYYRCIRPTFTGLRYEAITGQWGPLGDFYLGPSYLFEVVGTSGKVKIMSHLLYTVEETYDSLQDVSEQAFDAEHLNFKPFCDDIFGDG